MRSLIIAALAFCLIGSVASAQAPYRPSIAVGEPHPATPSWHRPRPRPPVIVVGVPSLYRPPVVGFGFGFAPYGYDEFGFPLTAPLVTPGFGFTYTPAFRFAVPVRPFPYPRPLPSYPRR